MNWEELMTKLGEPLWVPHLKKWRVLQSYNESLVHGKKILFTDSNEFIDFSEDLCESVTPKNIELRRCLLSQCEQEE